MPKKKIYIVIIFLSLAVAFSLNWKRIFLQEINIKFVCELPANKELPYIKFPDRSKEYEWFLVTNNSQYQNWLSAGLNLPFCDFSKNYLVVSKYKLKSIFYHPEYIDECCGSPPGFAELNRNNSKADKVYIYEMPNIMLTQGIG